MYISIFSDNAFVDQSKPSTQIYRKLHKFAADNSSFEKIDYFSHASV